MNAEPRPRSASEKRFYLAVAIANEGPLAYFGLTTLIVVATQVGRLALSQTELWMRFATWVTQ